jgi:hypothetical protein
LGHEKGSICIDKQGEPAPSYKMNQFKFETSGKVPIKLEESLWNIPQINKEKTN